MAAVRSDKSLLILFTHLFCFNDCFTAVTKGSCMLAEQVDNLRIGI